jgi:CDP-glycerol glycerophosphotransferase (TagB/SpsB family)
MKIVGGMKYWGQLLLLPIYWLSFLMPRDRKVWLFGSTFGRRFADNPKYLFLYISQHRAELGIRPVWITHSREIVRLLQGNGYEAYYYHSIKGIWLALRGKVYLFDNYAKDINFWQSGGAVKVNLWHGIPLKKIQADNLFDTFRHPRNLWEKWKNFPRNLSDEKPHHYVLATSDVLKPVFGSAFRTENVLVCGYPRNDSMLSASLRNLSTAKEEEALGQLRRKLEGGGLRMLYYMPTFRDSEVRFFEVVNMEELNGFLESNKLLLCVKLHPKSKLGRRFAEIGGRNVSVVDADADPYLFIRESSLLVTDYSSIYFDYLISGKPIVFFAYDLEEYKNASREMYFEYSKYTPGKKAYSWEELKEAILDSLDNAGQYQEERERLLEKMFYYGRNEASGILTQQIKAITERSMA